jgi:hypothetical protein
MCIYNNYVIRMELIVPSLRLALICLSFRDTFALKVAQREKISHLSFIWRFATIGIRLSDTVIVKMWAEKI